MELTSLIQYLRDACFSDDPDIVLDSEYVSLTDKQLEDILSVSSSRLKTSVDSLSEATLYPLVLLSKKEIYHRLAVKESPLYDIESDTGKLKRGSRFEHYYKLIMQINNEFQEYVRNEEANRDVSNTEMGNEHSHGDVFIMGRYHSSRNYKHMNRPKVSITHNEVKGNLLELKWKIKSVIRFHDTRIFLCEDEEVIDVFDDYAINPKAKELHRFIDIKRDAVRIKDLKQGVVYYLAVVIREQNTLIGYDEISFILEGDTDVIE